MKHRLNWDQTCEILKAMDGMDYWNGSPSQWSMLRRGLIRRFSRPMRCFQNERIECFRPTADGYRAAHRSLEARGCLVPRDLAKKVGASARKGKVRA